jgi:hypothetical protein
MAQTLSPLFGDYASDQKVAGVTYSRDGILIMPTISFTEVTGTYTLHIDPYAASRVFAWKTSFIPSYGPFVIMEDDTIDVTVPAPDGEYWLIGRWKWTAGNTDIQGHPDGLWISAMEAIYSIEVAPNDFIGTGTAEEPEVTSRTDGNGRTAVILGRVTVASGIPTFAFEPSTLTDMAYIGAKISELLADIAYLQGEISGINSKIDPITIKDSIVTTNSYTLTIKSGVMTQTLVV